MEYSDIYSYGKAGLGIVSDIAGAYSFGKQQEANSAAYRANTLNEIQRDKDSFLWQEHAKDRAEFGAGAYTEQYLWSGKQKLNSITKQLGDNNAALLMQTSIAYEQSAAVDETVGNMMSRNAVDTMKAEARIIAAKGGTGTESGTTDVAQRDPRSMEQFDNAVLIGRAANDKLNIHRRLSMERLSAKNKNKYIASQLGTVFSPTGASAAWEKGYAATYDGLTMAEKTGYIAHDEVQAVVGSSWYDTALDVIKVIEASDLDTAFKDLAGEWDFEACGGDKDCEDKLNAKKERKA